MLTKYKNKKIQLFLIIALSLGVFSIPLFVGASPINSEELLRLVNGERGKLSISPLSLNFKLTQAAYKKAKELFGKGYFAHTNPNGKPFYKWIDEEDYQYLYAGENLAIDFAENEDTVNAWMESRLHRDNILNKNYTETGLAALSGSWQGRQTNIAVQIFGSPNSPKPVNGNSAPLSLGELDVKKSDLPKIAGELVFLPSLAGEKYLDIIVRTGSGLNFNIGQNKKIAAIGISFNILLAGITLPLIALAYRRELTAFYKAKM